MTLVGAILQTSFTLFLCFKAHDGGVVAVELSRVSGGAPQLITIGADKTLAIWDTISFKVPYKDWELLNIVLEEHYIITIIYFGEPFSCFAIFFLRSCVVLNLFQNWLATVWHHGAILELQTLIY